MDGQMNGGKRTNRTVMSLNLLVVNMHDVCAHTIEEVLGMTDDDEDSIVLLQLHL